MIRQNYHPIITNSMLTRGVGKTTCNALEDVAVKTNEKLTWNEEVVPKADVHESLSVS